MATWDSYEDLGDGRVMFRDSATGEEMAAPLGAPASQAMFRIDNMGMAAPVAADPGMAALADAAFGGQDERTASASDVINSQLFGGNSPTSQIGTAPGELRLEQSGSMLDAGSPAQDTQIARVLTDAEAEKAGLTGKQKPAARPGLEDVLSQQLGISAPLPRGLKDAPKDGGSKSGQDDGVRFARSPQQSEPGSQSVGGAFVIPEHEQKLGRTTQRTVVDQEAMRDMRTAEEVERGAQIMLTEAQARQADAIAQEKSALASAVNQKVADQANAEKLRKDFMASKYSEIEAINRELDANQGINSEKFWEDRGAGSKFMGAIAVALGALGGNAELPSRLIESAVNREIDAQKANLANKNAKLTRYGAALSEYRQRFGDERAAEAQAKKDLFEAAAAKIEANMAASDSEIVRAKGAQALAELRKKAAELGVQVNSYVENASYRQVPKQVVTIGGGAVGDGEAGLTDADLRDPKLQKEAQEYAAAREKAGVNEGEASLTNAEAMISRYVGRDNVPGIQPENVAVRASKGVANFVAGEGSGDRMMYSKEENANRQTWEYVKANIRKAITGSGMSEGERADLNAMVDGAKDFASLANIASQVRNVVKARNRGVAAGFTPKAVALYEYRLRGSRSRESAPSSFQAVKGQ